jgi:RHS repeat-associated protein
VGNWDSVTTNSTTQTRGANKQNEITSVSGATTPTYDNNGNLTKDENDNRFVWDAWNMMVQVKNSSNVVIVTMGRDALHRHVTDTVGTSVTDRLFSEATQLLETKAGSNTVTRNVWSPPYVDAMVLRDRDTDANGTLDERIYSLQDANWNTTALVNISGTVVERDTYSPFGVATYRDASGSVISTSAKDWVFLHQGGEKIAAGDYEFRNRIYSPTLGRWLSNDPLGFDAGDVNTYRALNNNPILQIDPTGEIPPLLILGGMALGWLLFDPPPAQAPTQPGEIVVPPPNPGEKAIGVIGGAAGGAIAVGVVEVGTVVIGGAVRVGTAIIGGIASIIISVKKKTNLVREIENKIPENPARVNHIFRNTPGHLPDTPANRAMLQRLANDKGAVLGPPDNHGNTWAAIINPNGTQTWVQYRNGVIMNGGENQIPKIYNPQTGLSKP